MLLWFLLRSLLVKYRSLFFCMSLSFLLHMRVGGLISQFLYALERVSASVAVLRGPDGTGLDWTGL